MATKRLKRREFGRALGREMSQNKGSLIVFLVLSGLVIATMIRQFFLANYESVMLCLLTIVLLLIPALFQMKFRVEIPQKLEIIIFCFIYAAEIMGEVQNYYTAIPIWDTILHTTNGFLCAAIGFSLVVVLNNNDRFLIELSPFYVVVVGFCFSMTIGVLWEFFEFGMDYFLHFDMQKDTVVKTISSCLLDPTNSQKPYVISNIESIAINGEELPIKGFLDIGLIDTMKDLFVNFIGAVVFSVIGFLALKGDEKKKKFAMSFALSNKTEENDFLLQVALEDEKKANEDEKMLTVDEALSNGNDLFDGSEDK